jgi:8-oxo-dGTP diphosphatase
MTDEARTSASPDHRMLVCVGGVVRHGNQVLLVRQAKGHPLEGKWTIPWGIVEPPEAPEVAVLRETEEEGGIVAGVEGLLGVQDLEEDGWLALVFLCNHLDGEPRCDGRETDEAAYLSLAEIDSFQEPIEVWCEWLVRRVLTGEYSLIPLRGDNPYKPKLAFL